jgi:hypothetical protein
MKSVDVRLAPVEQHLGTTALGVGLPQDAHQHRSERSVLLEVNQKLAEGAGLWVPPIGADRVGALKVREHQDVEQLGGIRMRSAQRYDFG